MRECLAKYITIIYYACKTRHHGEYSCTCDLLKKTRTDYWGISDNREKCTCLTRNDLDDLIDVLFNEIFKTIDPPKDDEPQNEKEESSSINSTDYADSDEKKKVCDPVFEYSDIQEAEESFDKLISILNSKDVPKKVVEYFKSAKFRLDIICCYMALTHNRSVKNSNLSIVIELLFKLTDEEIQNNENSKLKQMIKVLFGPAKSTVFEKHIKLCTASGCWDKKYEKIFLDLYESYKAVRQLDLQRELDGYFLCFDEKLFTFKPSLESIQDVLSSKSESQDELLDFEMGAWDRFCVT